MSWRELLAALPSVPEREIEEFYARLVLGRQSGTAEEYLNHLIDEMALSDSVASHLRKQGSARLFVYRFLVRKTLRGVLESAIPRARARMGKLFDEAFEVFLSQVPIVSRCLRDLTPSFLDFLEQAEFDALQVEPYILELARLEAVRISVAARPTTKLQSSGDLDLERGLLFHASTEILEFRYAVHQLPDSVEDRSRPEKRPTYLLSYRDGENVVRYMNLSPLAFVLVRNLVEKMALGAALTQACHTQKIAIDTAVLNGASEVLADLAKRGIILSPG